MFGRGAHPVSHRRRGAVRDSALPSEVLLHFAGIPGASVYLEKSTEISIIKSNAWDNIEITSF